MLSLAEEKEENESEAGAELNIATMELSALFAGGLTSPKTMKLRGGIGQHEVLVLTDSGRATTLSVKG